MGTTSEQHEENRPATRANAAEQFVALLLVRHADALKELESAGRRRWPGLTFPGHWIPTASALAVIVLAGREELSIAESLRETRIVKGQKSRLTKPMENVAQEIGPALHGEAPFKSEWLHLLAKGLGAKGDEASELRSFHGHVSGGTLTALGLKQALRDVRKMESNRRGSLLMGHLSSAAESLRQLPPYYPRHLDVRKLAGVLEAGEVLRESLLDQGRAEGLYSDGGLRLGDLQPALQIVSGHSRCALLGDPGQGKTTVLAALALNHVVAERKPGLFARLDDIGRIAADRPPTSIQEAVESVSLAADARLSFFCPQEAKSDLVHQAITNPDFLLAFDGLDEVSTPERRAAVERVLHILSESIAGSIILSSRYAGYTRPAGVDVELGLAPMQASEVFVEDWFRGGSKQARDRALNAVQSDNIADLARIPLLAGFICYVAETESVRATKHGVYTQYVSLFLAQKWKAKHLWRSRPRILERERTATELAWFMATRPDPTSDAGTASAHLPKPTWAFTVSIREWSRESNVSDDMGSFLEDDGLLVPHGSSPSADDLEQPYRWLHRTIHEHLTGRALGQLVEEDSDRAFGFLKSALLRPAWAVVLEHAAAYMNERSTLPRVIDVLLRFVDEGDVDDKLTRAVASLHAYDNTAHRRDEILERLISGKCFNAAFQLDSKRLVRHFEKNLKEITHDDLNSLSYAANIWLSDEAFDEEWQPIVGKLHELGLANEAYFSLMAKSNKLEAERQTVELMKSDPIKFSAYRSRNILINASRETIASLLIAAKENTGNFHWQHEFLYAAQYPKHPDFPELVRSTFADQEPPHEVQVYLASPYTPVPWDLLDLHPKVIAAALHDPKTPPVVASTIAAFCPATALQPYDSLSQWARIGAWKRRPEEPGRPEFPQGWTAKRANSLLIQLQDRKDDPNITVGEIEDYHIAVRWGLQHPGKVSGRLLLDAVRLNDMDFYPKYWWIEGYHWLPAHLGSLPIPFILETLNDAFCDPNFDYSLTSMVAEVLAKRSPDEVDEVLSTILHLLNRYPDISPPIRSWYVPQDKEQATRWALDFQSLALIHAQSREFATEMPKVAVGWLESHDMLPAYWRRLVRPSG